MKTYAIGDVHGRADLLGATLKFIENEHRAAPTGYRVIFLGDIIDRGADSRAAMDLVVAELDRCSGSRLILGNHEEFLLLFLDRPDKRHLVFDHWMSNGGLAAAASYGLDVKRRYSGIDDAHQELLGLLQSHPDHIAALRNASLHVVAGEYIFVHAGLRPGVRMAYQTEKDIRTIRSDFLNSSYDFGRKVVHGHTETESGRPEVYGNRIALDTAANATGVLSTLVIETKKDNRFFSTRSGRTGVEVSLINPAVFLTLDDVKHEVAKRWRAQR
ncbi:metallophosphoesterase [Rhizobium ruizarguesonis]